VLLYSDATIIFDVDEGPAAFANPVKPVPLDDNANVTPPSAPIPPNVALLASLNAAKVTVRDAAVADSSFAVAD
jgi:hypothetical protein